mgnify:CR=1 FL=1|jgi:hypothetical protein|tara:strand:+ start:19422 stop:19943 length:522 start_codon:yes stop_codon:yes gene_type:complete
MNRRPISITNGKAVKDILNKAVEVFNIPLRTLKSKTRRQPVQIARMVVSNICSLENKIHHTDICPELNRDRTSIYHYEKMHASNFATFPLYRDAYNTLYNQLYTNPLPLLTELGIKNILDGAGLTGNEGKISIIISSGLAKYTISENNASFSRTSAILQELLKGYYHQIDIKI